MYKEEEMQYFYPLSNPRSSSIRLLEIVVDAVVQEAALIEIDKARRLTDEIEQLDRPSWRSIRDRIPRPTGSHAVESALVITSLEVALGRVGLQVSHEAGEVAAGELYGAQVFRIAEWVEVSL